MSTESPDPSTQLEDNTEPSANESSSEAKTDMHELLGELRAEVTRLKAENAKAEAQNWIQRHPLLAVALSMGVGAAAGYGASSAFRPRAPRTLSEHARERLRRLSDDARELAVRMGQRLGEQAAASGAEVRKRAERAGQRLAREAREAGMSASREAQDLARSASEQARRAGEEASQSLREATDEAARRFEERRTKAGEDARELGKALGEKASERVKKYAADGSSDASESSGRPFTRSLLALAGLAAGGYLAAKVRNSL